MTKYNEIMDRLEIDDEMRDRVLAGAARKAAAAPRVRAVRIQRFLIPAACFVLLIVGVLAVPAVMPGPESAVEVAATSSSSSGVAESSSASLRGNGDGSSSTASGTASGESSQSAVSPDSSRSSSASSTAGGAATDGQASANATQQPTGVQATPAPSVAEADSPEPQREDQGEVAPSEPDNSGNANDQMPTDASRQDDSVREESATSVSSSETAAVDDGEIEVSFKSNAVSQTPEAAPPEKPEESPSGANRRQGESSSSDQASSQSSPAESKSASSAAGEGEKLPEPTAKVEGETSEGGNAISIKGEPDALDNDGAVISDAKALSSAAGVSIAEVPVLAAKAEAVEYLRLGEGSAEIGYTLPKRVVRYRAQTGTSPADQVAGFDIVKKDDSGEVTVRYAGDDEGFTVAAWKSGKVTYTLTVSDPVKKTTLAGYVESALSTQ